MELKNEKAGQRGVETAKNTDDKKPAGFARPKNGLKEGLMVVAAAAVIGSCGGAESARQINIPYDGGVDKSAVDTSDLDGGALDSEEPADASTSEAKPSTQTVTSTSTQTAAPTGTQTGTQTVTVTQTVTKTDTGTETAVDASVADTSGGTPVDASAADVIADESVADASGGTTVDASAPDVTVVADASVADSSATVDTGAGEVSGPVCSGLTNGKYGGYISLNGSVDTNGFTFKYEGLTVSDAGTVVSVTLGVSCGTVPETKVDAPIGVATDTKIAGKDVTITVDRAGKGSAYVNVVIKNQ